MSACVKPGQPLKIVMTLGQSVPYGSDSAPIVSTDPGTALTYTDGPRRASSNVICTREFMNGKIGETPSSAMGNYIQNKLDEMMDRNRSPQVLSVNISTPGSGIKDLLPDGKDKENQWDYMYKHFSVFPSIKQRVEAPSAECLGTVLYHGDKDGRGNMTGTEYNHNLEKVRVGLETLTKGFLNQTSPMRIFIFVNSNSAHNHRIQDANMKSATTGTMQSKYFIIGPTYFLGRKDETQSVHNSGYGNYIAGVYAGRAIYQFRYENRVPDHIRPINWSRNGNTITIYYRVPTPPLVRKDIVYPGGNPSKAKARLPNDGYSIYTEDASKNRNTKPFHIDNVLIDGTMVQLTCNQLSGYSGKVYVTYALWNYDMFITDYGTRMGGNVCDSTTEIHVMPTGEEYELRHWVPNHILEF